MKNFSSIIAAAAAVVAIAGATHADPTPAGASRIFNFVPNTGLDADYSTAGDVNYDLKALAKTTVNVPAYLYVKGNMNGTWTVDGWGAGASTKPVQTLEVFHNQILQIGVSGFANPSDGNVVSVDPVLTYDVSVKGADATGAARSGYTFTNSTNVAAAAVNSAVNGALIFPHVPVGSGGRLTLDLTPTLTIAPGTLAGTYSNSPTVTITR